MNEFLPFPPKTEVKRPQMTDFHTEIGGSGSNVPLTLPLEQAPVVAYTEDEALPFALPSKYAFYDFKDLYIKPFKGRQLRKLSKAREEASTLYTVEAVSAVLSNTRGDVNLAFQLTVPDFYATLFWLRLNSFTKAFLTHKTMCRNPVHLERVGKKELDPETLKISEIITKSSIKETVLEAAPNPEAYPLEYPDITLAPCIMLDTIALLDDEQFADEEFRAAASIACYIRVPGKPSLRDRIAIVDELSADDWATIERWEKAVSDYGVAETVRIKCKCCGHTQIDSLLVDAHSFFQ